MRRSVDLSKQATVNKRSKRYVYWVIRWYDTMGKRRSQHLGRADQLSKRQAENLRRPRSNIPQKTFTASKKTLEALRISATAS